MLHVIKMWYKWFSHVRMVHTTYLTYFFGDSTPAVDLVDGTCVFTSGSRTNQNGVRANVRFRRFMGIWPFILRSEYRSKYSCLFFCLEASFDRYLAKEAACKRDFCKMINRNAPGFHPCANTETSGAAARHSQTFTFELSIWAWNYFLHVDLGVSTWHACAPSIKPAAFEEGSKRLMETDSSLLD